MQWLTNCHSLMISPASSSSAFYMSVTWVFNMLNIHTLFCLTFYQIQQYILLRFLIGGCLQKFLILITRYFYSPEGGTAKLDLISLKVFPATMSLSSLRNNNLRSFQPKFTFAWCRVGRIGTLSSLNKLLSTCRTLLELA